MRKNAQTVTYSSNLIVSAIPATLYGFAGFNSAATGQFILLFDAIELPPDGEVPIIQVFAAAGSNFSLDYGTLGRVFKNGIIICNSSIGETKIIGADDIWIDAQYK